MLSIATFNLRYSWSGDGANSFISRAGNILTVLDNIRPDVICFQEGVEQNIDFLSKYLESYHIVFNQRNSDFGGEGLATAYRKDKFRLLELNFFWLSPTPDVPGSRYHGQSPCPRICQSALFKRIEDGKLFRTYNIHLDHVSDRARILGIQSVMNKVKEDNSRFDLPFFILGDFNAEPKSETIRFCDTHKSPEIVDLTRDIQATFHDFGRDKRPSKIDYIYSDLKTATQAHGTKALTDCINGIYLSDHYPVVLDIDL